MSRVLITGASRGIGAALAQSLRSRGIATCSAGRSLAWPPSADGEDVSAQLDVRESASVNRLFEWLDDNWGAPTHLVNCAGVGTFRSIEATTDEQWRVMVETNLTGAFYCIRAALPRMANGGRVINIGSIAGDIPIADNGAYGASKAGLAQLSRIVNAEAAHGGVTSTLVSLGAVNTGIWEGREGFRSEDMLELPAVIETLVHAIEAPLNARLETISLWPPKGVL